MAFNRGAFTKPRGYRGGGAFAIPEWTPLQIPNLAAWHRADQGVSLSGTKVTAWADLSGRGRTLSQGTDGLRPTLETGVLNGCPVVRFASASKLLSWTAWAQASAVTAFAVVKYVTGEVYQLLMHRSAGEGFFASHTTDDVNKPTIAGSGADLKWGAALSNGGGYLIRFAYTTGESDRTRYLGVNNGTEVSDVTASTTLGNWSSVGINSGSFALLADVAELVVYDRLLTAAESDAVWAYAKARYGL